MTSKPKSTPRKNGIITDYDAQAQHKSDIKALERAKAYIAKKTKGKQFTPIKFGSLTLLQYSERRLEEYRQYFNEQGKPININRMYSDKERSRDDRDAEIIELYGQGESIKALAEKYGLHTMTIRNILKKQTQKR